MPMRSPRISPTVGETKIKRIVFTIPFITSDPEPAFTSAAPTSPPIRAWEELVGRPIYQVMISQRHAPISVAKMIVGSMIPTSTIPFPIVLATCSPRNRKATKLKKAAQITAYLGESTRVETMVAIEFAESWNPFRKSNVSASMIRKKM
jgi:hypothetical protein